MEAAEAAGDKYHGDRLRRAYEAVKEANIAYDIYLSKMSIGEIVSKRLLLRDGSRYLLPRSSDELAKAFNTPKINKKIAEILEYAPSSEEARLAILMYGDRSGHLGGKSKHKAYF